MTTLIHTYLLLDRRPGGVAARLLVAGEARLAYRCPDAEGAAALHALLRRALAPTELPAAVAGGDAALRRKLAERHLVDTIPVSQLAAGDGAPWFGPAAVGHPYPPGTTCTRRYQGSCTGVASGIGSSSMSPSAGAGSVVGARSISSAPVASSSSGSGGAAPVLPNSCGRNTW